MDIDKANFFTITQFGNKDLFTQKLKKEYCDLNDIKNMRDGNGVSLLEKSLIYRKFDISQLLLDNNVQVNIVSKDNCNELHYLVSNIEGRCSLDIAKQLVELNVDLNLPDKRYGNTPFWYLCELAIRKNKQDIIELIELCMIKSVKLDVPNSINNTVRNLIVQRGSEELKNIVLGGTT